MTRLPVVDMLVEAQEAAGLSNGAIARAAAVQPSSVTRYKSGAAEPSLHVAVAWARACGAELTVSRPVVAAVQVLVNGINQLLDSYGAEGTIDINTPTFIRQGNDAEVAQLARDMAAGRVGAVVFYNANPAYSYPDAAAFHAALAKVPVRVSLGTHADETGSRCDYLLPSHHYLESWGDVEVQGGELTVVQPAISPIFNTRSALSTFAKWGGQETDAYTFVRNFWNGNVGAGETFWQNSVHNGYTTGARPALATQLAGIPRYANNLTALSVDAAANQAARAAAEGIEVVLHEKGAIGNGNMSSNPWLHEMADSISRTAWDHYVSVNPHYAKEKGIETGDVLTVTVNGKSVSLPALIQPGQARDTIAIAIGYGREGDKGGKAAEGLGQNVYPMARLVNGALQFNAAGATIAKTGENIELAFVQTSLTEAGRPIVKETTLAEYKADPYAGNKERVHLVSLWEKHPKNGHYWAMAIDLNACTGCGVAVSPTTKSGVIPPPPSTVRPDSVR